MSGFNPHSIGSAFSSFPELNMTNATNLPILPPTLDGSLSSSSPALSHNRNFDHSDPVDDEHSPANETGTKTKRKKRKRHSNRRSCRLCRVCFSCCQSHLLTLDV
jgi:hypothetical protein